MIHKAKCLENWAQLTKHHFTVYFLEKSQFLKNKYCNLPNGFIYFPFYNKFLLHKAVISLLSRFVLLKGWKYAHSSSDGNVPVMEILLPALGTSLLNRHVANNISGQGETLPVNNRILNITLLELRSE